MVQRLDSSPRRPLPTPGLNRLRSPFRQRPRVASIANNTALEGGTNAQLCSFFWRNLLLEGGSGAPRLPVSWRTRPSTAPNPRARDAESLSANSCGPPITPGSSRHIHVKRVCPRRSARGAAASGGGWRRAFPGDHRPVGNRDSVDSPSCADRRLLLPLLAIVHGVGLDPLQGSRVAFVLGKALDVGFDSAELAVEELFIRVSFRRDIAQKPSNQRQGWIIYDIHGASGKRYKVSN
jgi:hypothetical protein